jgi:GntR family transcriptional regulator/MocR family aminotransferase
VPALAALQPDAVAHLGSASKTLVPGMRIGWMVLPHRDRQAVGRVLADDRTGPSTVDQRALALLMADGGYDRHVRRARRIYRTRRDGLAAALSSTAPQVRVRGIDAGLHLLLDVRSADDRGLVADLRRRGVQAMAAGDCRLEAAEPSGLLVGYGNLPEHRIPAVAGAIAEALRRA